MDIQEQTAYLTENELGTIRDQINALNDPEIGQIIEAIVKIFTEIHNKVVALNEEKDNTSIHISVEKQMLRLHEESIAKTRHLWQLVTDRLRLTSSRSTQTLSITKKGFNYVSDGHSSNGNINSREDRKALIDLLSYFHEKLKTALQQFRATKKRPAPKNKKP